MATADASQRALKHLTWYLSVAASADGQQRYLSVAASADGQQRPIGTLEREFGAAYGLQKQQRRGGSAIVGGEASPSQTVNSQPTGSNELASSSSQPNGYHAEQRSPISSASPAGHSAAPAGSSSFAQGSSSAEQSAAPAAAVAGPTPANDPDHPGPMKLGTLIDYLEMEVEQKALRSRAAAYEKGEDARLVGHGLLGQEALHAYVAELVSIIRDFPYERLSEDKAVVAWVRDTIVAKTFQGWWSFYSNRKVRDDFDVLDLEKVLCGDGMLLARLKYAAEHLR